MPAENLRSRFITVQLQRVNLDRDGRAILRDVRWCVKPGERWVVLGANGAGKTQLLKVLAGAVWPNADDDHRLRWQQHGAWHRSPASLIEDIGYLGPERQDRHERHGWNHRVREVVGTGIHRSDIPLLPLNPSQRRRVAAVLRSLRLTRLAARRFLTLSYGERRRVLLARALASRPALLLLDELLSGLDPAQRTQVMTWLERSAGSRLPWVLTAHRAEEVPLAATHLLVLRQGQVQYAGRLRRPALQRFFAQLEVGAMPQRQTRQRAASLARGQASGRSTWFRFRDASLYLDYRPVLRHIDWQVRDGEFWVVRGANGSGKSSLLRAIYGDFPVAAGGELQRRGIQPGVPLSEFRRHCGFVAPHLQTDYPRDTSVLEVVASGLHSSIGLNEALSAAERRRARKALALLDAEQFADLTLGQLSYGQVRRVLFARALVHEPGLLLLDEAFAGLDSGTRARLLNRVRLHVAAGGSAVLATHYDDEIPAQLTGELRLCAGRAELSR